MRIVVVVVVKLFAAKPDRDRRYVPTCILHVEVPIADGVTNAVDDARCPERYPYHLNPPHERADEESEQVDVRKQHYEDSHPVQARQDMRSEEHTSELQSRLHLVCRLLLEKK